MQIKSRLVELDSLRGIAVLMVVLFHYTSRYNIVFDSHNMDLFRFKFGHYGVQLFFILSGFVIFLTLNRTESGWDFVKRRFVRLYPTFWLCLLITFVITSNSNIVRFQRDYYDLLMNFTMVPELFNSKTIDGVYWSLLIELIFYGLMFFLYKARMLKRIVVVGYIWLIVCSLIFLFVDSSILKLFLLADFCYLFIGGICFYRLWMGVGSWSNHYLIVGCVIYSFSFKGIEEGLFSILFFTIFYLFILQKLKFLGKSKILVFLGVISYPLYLLHQFIGLIIINWLIKNLTENYLILLLIPITISILISAVIVYYFEKRWVEKLKAVLIKKTNL